MRHTIWCCILFRCVWSTQSRRNTRLCIIHYHCTVHKHLLYFSHTLESRWMWANEYVMLDCVRGGVAPHPPHPHIHSTPNEWNEHTKLEARMACIAITSVSFIHNTTVGHIAYVIRWTADGHGGARRTLYIEVSLLWICRCQISVTAFRVHLTTSTMPLLLVELRGFRHVRTRRINSSMNWTEWTEYARNWTENPIEMCVCVCVVCGCGWRKMGKIVFNKLCQRANTTQASGIYNILKFVASIVMACAVRLQRESFVHFFAHFGFSFPFSLINWSQTSLVDESMRCMSMSSTISKHFFFFYFFFCRDVV